MNIYLRAVLTFVWLAISCTSGMVLCLFRWGDINLDHDFARIFGWGASRILGLRVDLDGEEHLNSPQPCIYVANHQNNLDLVVLSQVTPRRVLVIGKKELIWIPFFGLFFYASGNIMIDRKKRVQAITGLDQAARLIRKKGAGVWIFPEGTRNRTTQPMLPFKKGAFYTAIKAGVPIVPVVISETHSLLDWKKVRWKRASVRIRALPPVDTRSMTEKDTDRLSQDVRQRMLEAFSELKTTIVT